MTENSLELLELKLLLQAMHERYGYDFRAYARAPLERRVNALLPSFGCATLAELIPKVLHDEALFLRLAHALTSRVTEMFRDPFVYGALRERVLPVLRTWPRAKLWLAGCGTGEELYSIAILLAEEGLADRTAVYATDFNEQALITAREGIYAFDRIRDFTPGYLAAGGKRAFSDYYLAKYSAAVMAKHLRANVTFAAHNLATDGAFGEMHLIVCRNVLIDFGRELQERALSLFAESLVHGGFLCLGTNEDLLGSAAASGFEEVDRGARIFRRVRRR